MASFEPYLSAEQVESFHRDGFLVLEKFWDEGTVENLRRSIHSILDGFDPSSSKTVFSTKEQKRKSDEYFLTSGGEVRFFWEEKAFDSEGNLQKPAAECINKVGHALHDKDPHFQKASYDPRIGKICRELGMVKPLSVQSMFIFKQAYIGGEVCPHQDGSFLYTEPQTCIGFWWALDNCSLDNGCLWATPGSHKEGVRRRFKRKGLVSEGTEFVNVADGSPNVGAETFDTRAGVPLEMPKGTLVILHDAVVHWSEANISAAPRYAYSIHVVDGEAKYPADNWLQRDEPFNEIGVQ
jgi:phytanoyl-CoA hydroxylase